MLRIKLINKIVEILNYLIVLISLNILSKYIIIYFLIKYKIEVY